MSFQPLTISATGATGDSHTTEMQNEAAVAAGGAGTGAVRAGPVWSGGQPRYQLAMHSGGAAAAASSVAPSSSQPQTMFARAAPTAVASMMQSSYPPKQGGGPQLSVYSAGAPQQQPRAPIREPFPASQQDSFYSQPLQQQGLQQVHSQQVQRQQMMQQQAAVGMQRGPSPARFNPSAGGMSHAVSSARAPMSFAGFDADAGRSFTPPARAQPLYAARSQQSSAGAQAMPFSLSQQPAKSSRSHSAMEVRTQDDSGWSGRGQQQQPRQQVRFAPQPSLSQQAIQQPPMQQQQHSPSLSGQKHRMPDDSLAAQVEAKVQRMAAAGGLRVSLPQQQREGEPTAPATEAKPTEEEKVEAAPSVGQIQVASAVSEAAAPAPAPDASMEVATISAPAAASESQSVVAESQSQSSIAHVSSDTQEIQTTAVAPMLQDAGQLTRVNSEDAGEIVADASSREPSSESFVLVQHSPKQDSAAADAAAHSDSVEAVGREIPVLVAAADGDSSMEAAGDSSWNAEPDSQQRDQVEQGTSLQSVPDSSMAQPEEQHDQQLPQRSAVNESIIEEVPDRAVAAAASAPASVTAQVVINQRIEPPIVQEKVVLAAAAAIEAQPSAAAATAPQFALHSQKKGSIPLSLPMPEPDEAEEEANQQMGEERKDDKASEPVLVTRADEPHPVDTSSARARADAYGDASDNDLSNEAILFSDDASAQAAAPAGLGFVRASSMLPTAAISTASIPQDTQSLLSHVQDCLMKLTESQARERMLSAQLAAMAGIEDKVRALENGKRSMQNTHRNELAAKERAIAELQKKTREHQEYISNLQSANSGMHEALADIVGIAQAGMQTEQ